MRRCVQFFQFICVWRNNFSTYTDIAGFIVIRVKFVLNLELTLRLNIYFDGRLILNKVLPLKFPFGDVANKVLFFKV